MNDGVKLILERLKTNPEDFLPSGRFRSVADSLMELASGPPTRLKISGDTTSAFYFLTDKEKQLLKDAWIECAREQFTARILETLMAEKPESEYRYYPQSAGGLQIGGPYNTANLTNSIPTNSTLQNEMLTYRARSLKEEVEQYMSAYNQQAKQAK